MIILLTISFLRNSALKSYAELDGDTTDLSDSSDDKSDCEPQVKKAKNLSEEKDQQEDTFQKRNNADANDKIACDISCICGKIFSQKQNLLRHIRIIHSSNKIKCEWCSKEFSRKDSLMRHQRMRCQKGSSSNKEVLNPMSHRAGTTGTTESTGSVPGQSQILSEIDIRSRVRSPSPYDSIENSYERHDNHDENDSNGSIKNSDETSDQHDDQYMTAIDSECSIHDESSANCTQMQTTGQPLMYDDLPPESERKSPRSAAVAAGKRSGQQFEVPVVIEDEIDSNEKTTKTWIDLKKTLDSSDIELTAAKAKEPSEEKDKHLRQNEDNHQERKNADAEDKIACDVCGKIFSQKFSLLRHIRIHSSNKIKCELCGKEFTRKDSLQRHQKTCKEGLKDSLKHHQKTCKEGSLSKDEALIPTSQSTESVPGQSHSQIPTTFRELFRIQSPSPYDLIKNSDEKPDDLDENDSNGSIKNSDEISDQLDDQDMSACDSTENEMAVNLDEQLTSNMFSVSTHSMANPLLAADDQKDVIPIACLETNEKYNYETADVMEVMVVAKEETEDENPEQNSNERMTDRADVTKRMEDSPQCSNNSGLGENRASQDRNL